MKRSILFDTSFFIRLLNPDDSLHENAKGYYKYLIEKEYILKISTISIAEYCVKGTIDELPLRNLQIVPFNLDHAQRTGEFASIIFKENNVAIEKLKPRAIIPNDSKLFAQADCDPTLDYFITSDRRSKQTHNLLKKQLSTKFEIVDISTPYHQTFGVLDLE